MTREQTEVLEQIATAQSQAIQDFVARMQGEAFPVPYQPSYANHGCAMCGGTGMMADDILCGCQP